MNQPIINKVASSGLMTINMSKYLPTSKVVDFDIKEFLFKGLILKEKDFRSAMKELDWSKFQDMNVAIHCSSDAIIPRWAYMLIGSLIQVNANYYAFGTKESVLEKMLLENLAKINFGEYKDQKVIIKGCGNPAVTEAAYTEITRLLMPEVASLMFGEACSTVPIFKRKK